MKGELVIGANGYIGSLLRRKAEAEGTSRRNPYLLPDNYFLDLSNFKTGDLPPAEVVYLCAGVNGAMACEGNPEAFRVNVDATVDVMNHYARLDTFVVWLSSRSVEWSSTAYARQKSYVEAAMRANRWIGIVRAGRVTNENIEGLVQKMIEVGRGHRAGVHIWGDDRVAYQR